MSEASVYFQETARRYIPKVVTFTPEAEISSSFMCLQSRRIGHWTTSFYGFTHSAYIILKIRWIISFLNLSLNYFFSRNPTNMKLNCLKTSDITLQDTKLVPDRHSCFMFERHSNPYPDGVCKLHFLRHPSQFAVTMLHGVLDQKASLK